MGKRTILATFLTKEIPPFKLAFLGHFSTHNSPLPPPINTQPCLPIPPPSRPAIAMAYASAPTPTSSDIDLLDAPSPRPLSLQTLSSSTFEEHSSFDAQQEISIHTQFFCSSTLLLQFTPAPFQNTLPFLPVIIYPPRPSFSPSTINSKSRDPAVVVVVLVR